MIFNNGSTNRNCNLFFKSATSFTFAHLNVKRYLLYSASE